MNDLDFRVVCADTEVPVAYLSSFMGQGYVHHTYIILKSTSLLSFNERSSYLGLLTGLEAMQLLSCLNLSYNKLSSFSALGPLRLLKSLKVLDISYNEIGLHSTDTTRYLFSSPLSHTEDIDWTTDEIVSGGINQTYHWEAFLIFKGLNITQIDVSGNAIENENFKAFVIRFLPKVKWLNGELLH